MGRTYLFECSRCGYRAEVAGGVTEGRDVRLETVLCHDCKALYDAVVRLRVPLASSRPTGRSRLLLSGAGLVGSPPSPPTAKNALNRLVVRPVAGARWQEFAPACPKSALHRVVRWRVPGKCPKCGEILDPGALPLRTWD